MALTRVLKFQPLFSYFKVFSPVKTVLPQWYKDSKQFYKTPVTFETKAGTAKLCSPFLDALTSGYVLTLMGDVSVTQFPDGKRLTWGLEEAPLAEVRNINSLGNMPIPPGYDSQSSFAWKTNIAFEIPKGYSLLFTHPLNRYDLPFLTFSGIVDDFDMASGNLPFLLQDDFEGVIPQGTPICQIIPIKQEHWSSKEVTGLTERATFLQKNALLVLKGWYRKNVRKTKVYN